MLRKDKNAAMCSCSKKKYVHSTAEIETDKHEGFSYSVQSFKNHVLDKDFACEVLRPELSQ